MLSALFRERFVMPNNTSVRYVQLGLITPLQAGSSATAPALDQRLRRPLHPDRLHLRRRTAPTSACRTSAAACPVHQGSAGGTAFSLGMQLGSESVALQGQQVGATTTGSRPGRPGPAPPRPIPCSLATSAAEATASRRPRPTAQPVPPSPWPALRSARPAPVSPTRTASLCSRSTTSFRPKASCRRKTSCETSHRFRR